MMVLRNGQQIEFSLNAEGDLIQDTPFRAQAGFVIQVRNYLLPLGDDDKIIVVAANPGLARQMVAMFLATVAEEEAAALAAKRAEEDAVWEAAAHRSARGSIAAQVAEMDDSVMNLLLTQAHARRSNLVNLYTGDDRKALIAEEDLIIGVIEEEFAERRGLASSLEILQAFAV